MQRTTVLRIDDELRRLRRIWEHPGAPEDSGWPQEGVAILGDLAGIQLFVLRPVPGAAGAARRLRARSFEVSAWSQLIANHVVDAFAPEDAAVFYSAGGHFLIRSGLCADWRERIAALQNEIDFWLLKQLGGEVRFHLAACEFHDGFMPGEALHRELVASRRRPLAGALQGAVWNSELFFEPTGKGSERCGACARTVTRFETLGGEKICPACAADTKLGGILANTKRPVLTPDAKGLLAGFGTDDRSAGAGARKQAYRVESAEKAGPGAVEIDVVRWMPRNARGEALTLEDIAELAPGDHKWLGYLRMDADGVGAMFRSLNGSPARTAALSQFLNLFFADGIQELISTRFPNIYPVYGGGDDLFVIGAWHHVVDFAAAAQAVFRSAQGELTLSAGLAFATAHEHVLSGSREAARNLQAVKDGQKNGFRLFGESIGWGDFETVRGEARRAANWAHAEPRRQPELPRAFLHRLLGLHDQWTLLNALNSAPRKQRGASEPRLHPARVAALLTYHIDRNFPRRPTEQKDWARRFLGLSGPLWRHAGFIARYAILASGKTNEERRRGDGAPRQGTAPHRNRPDHNRFRG